MSSHENIFGLPEATLESAEVVFFGVPWEATVSYRSGTKNGPKGILNASPQVDFFHPRIQRDVSGKEFFYLGELNVPVLKNEVVHAREGDQEALEKVNQASRELNSLVKEQTSKILKMNKKVGLLGGDHSVPLGAYQALDEPVTIVHIDAHMDLRNAYEGFQNSHASIMRNAVSCSNVQKIIQFGIRDYCQEEYEFGKQNGIETYFDRRLADLKRKGRFDSEVFSRLQQIDSPVWISMDIDGLDPTLCPNTGTPVPGGLSWNDFLFILDCLKGKKIKGFDLVEVSAPDVSNGDDWDSIVGMRAAWELGILAVYNQ